MAYFMYQSAKYPRDCHEAVTQCSSNNVKSGVFMIKPDQYPDPFEVYCENNKRSKGWMVSHEMLICVLCETKVNNKYSL